MLTMTGIMATCLLSGAIASQAKDPAAATASFVVDTQQISGPFDKIWEGAVGSGHASLTLRADWQEYYAKAVRDIGFSRTRFHGVMDDDMSTYLDGKTNMANVLKSYQFIVDQGTVPIIELGFFPLVLSGNPDVTQFHYKGGNYVPSNYSRWEPFVTEFLQTLVDADIFGGAQGSVKVEVWNEPDCGFLQPASGPCGQHGGNQSAYWQLYNATSRALKAVDGGSFRVAGPVTAQVGWISDMIEWAKQNDAPLDLISSHLYPTDPIVNQTDRMGFLSTVQGAARTAQQANLPFSLTEFNAGLGQNTEDHPFSGAFVAHVASYAQEMLVPYGVDLISFWCVSDVFEEQGFISAPFHNGFGLQTLHGVPKPAYRAMQLLHALGDAQLKVSPGTGQAGPDGARIVLRPNPSDPQGPPLVGVAGHDTPKGSSDVIAAASGAASIGSIDVVATLPGGNIPAVLQGSAPGIGAEPYHAYAVVSSYEPSGVAIDSNTTVSVRFTGIAGDAPGTAMLVRVDDTHSNARATWESQGKPKYPSKSQIEEMQVASQLQADQQAVTRCGAGCVEVSVNVPAYGVVFIAV